MLKIGSVVVPLLFCTASLFAKASDERPCSPCLPGESFQPECYSYPAAYLAKAAINIENCSDWSWFADASFTYWWSSEEGLYIAENAIQNPDGVAILPPAQTLLTLAYDYQPGFKVGIGTIYNSEWNLRGEYTWFRGTDTVNEEAPVNDSGLPGIGIWNLDNWFQQTNNTRSLMGSQVAASWKLGLDMADLDLSRSCYIGSRFTLLPFAGLRTAWIRQTVSIDLTESPRSLSAGTYPPQPIQSLTVSHSWGIGPRLGLEARLLLPMGWRLEASGAGNLIINRYTTLSHTEQAYQSNSPNYRLSKNGSTVVNQISEAGLGLGWGSYLSGKDYHVDFQASYDVLLFFDANILRRMLDNSWAATGGGGGNLYFQGLTLTGRFDF